MILKFQIDGITAKAADDLSEEIIVYMRDEMGLLVTDYWIEDDGS